MVQPLRKVATRSIDVVDVAEVTQALAWRSSGPLQARCEEIVGLGGFAEGEGKDKAVMSSVVQWKVEDVLVNIRTRG